jgi:hypothetical protein
MKAKTRPRVKAAQLKKVPPYQFGEHTLKLLARPDGKRVEARSLLLDVMRALARGSQITGRPWDPKLVQKSAREVCEILGEDYEFEDDR